MFYKRFMDLPVFLKQLKCLLFILSHQCSVPNNIGEHYGCELAGGRHKYCGLYYLKLMKRAELWENTRIIHSIPIFLSNSLNPSSFLNGSKSLSTLMLIRPKS